MIKLNGRNSVILVEQKTEKSTALLLLDEGIYLRDKTGNMSKMYNACDVLTYAWRASISREMLGERRSERISPSRL
jgi:hypothetical protein